MKSGFLIYNSTLFQKTVPLDGYVFTFVVRSEQQTKFPFRLLFYHGKPILKNLKYCRFFFKLTDLAISRIVVNNEIKTL